jgi:hypothetical protein
MSAHHLTLVRDGNSLQEIVQIGRLWPIEECENCGNPTRGNWLDYLEGFSHANSPPAYKRRRLDRFFKYHPRERLFKDTRDLKLGRFPRLFTQSREWVFKSGPQNEGESTAL